MWRKWDKYDWSVAIAFALLLAVVIFLAEVVG